MIGIKNNKKVSGVYRMTDMVTGKTYVGSSVDVYRRISEHRRNCRYAKNKNFGKGFYKDLAARPEDFEWELMTAVHDERYLADFEALAILGLKTIEFGYNSQIPTVSQRTRGSNPKTTESMLGHPVSEETRRRMAESAKARGYCGRRTV